MIRADSQRSKKIKVDFPERSRGSVSPVPTDAPDLTRRDRVLLRWEIIAVFAVSLGASGLYAFISLIGSLTAQASLHSQSVTLNGSQAPGRPLLDLFLQLDSLAQRRGAGAACALPACSRAAADWPASIGLNWTQPGRDFLRGAALAALIGFSGLGLYFIAYKSGIALNVVAEGLPDVWWRFPVLILSALQNGLLEEVLVTGYLLTRLRKLGVNPAAAIAISATLRGSYHLYQGFGGFLGNAVMGVIFGVLFLRWRRVGPDDHRAHADRRGRFHRLCAARRPRLLATVKKASR